MNWFNQRQEQQIKDLKQQLDVLQRRFEVLESQRRFEVLERDVLTKGVACRVIKHPAVKILNPNVMGPIVLGERTTVPRVGLLDAFGALLAHLGVELVKREPTKAEVTVERVKQNRRSTRKRRV